MSSFNPVYPALPIGVVQPLHVTRESRLTPIDNCLSEFSDEAPALLKPCVLNGHPWEPALFNRAAFPNALPAFPDIPDLEALVRKVLLRPVIPNDCLADCKKVYSFEQAISGIPGTEFGPLDMSTSAGWPWVNTGHTSKGYWLKDPDRLASVKKEVELKIDLLKRGVLPCWYVMDVLKDERRPLAKVQAGKTRVVCPVPMDLLIICRMYFGGFVRWSQAHRIQNGHTVGMNPYSQEWDFLAKEIFRQGHDKAAGDIGKFDVVQPHALIDPIFRVIDEFYDGPPEDKLVRYLLAKDYKNPKHILPAIHLSPNLLAVVEREAQVPNPDPFTISMAQRMLALHCLQGSLVYQWFAGHASGSYLTTIINSSFSLVSPFCAAMLNGMSLKDVDRSLQDHGFRVWVLGDDFVVSIHKAYQQYFDQLKYAEYCSRLGMELTREDKGKIVHPFLQESPIFLKRTFEFRQETLRDFALSRWVGALALPAIIAPLCWANKANPTVSEVRLLYSAQFEELSLHGRAVFDQYAPKFRRALSQFTKVPEDAPSYEQALGNILAREGYFRP
jgi:hypothetical protein